MLSTETERSRNQSNVPYYFPVTPSLLMFRLIWNWLSCFVRYLNCSLQWWFCFLGYFLATINLNVCHISTIATATVETTTEKKSQHHCLASRLQKLRLTET